MRQAKLDGKGTKTSMRHKLEKLVVVGDGNCGKISLLVTYVDNTFPEQYVPTIFETHVVEIKVSREEQKVPMILWDTAGQENYDMLRPISYPGTDVFIVCFSVDNPDSYHNVASKWIPEVRHFADSVPVILVATKTDLRVDPKVVERLVKSDQRPINTDEGLALAQTISACAYVECSAKQKEGVDKVFRTAAETSILRRRCSKKPVGRLCVIL